MSVPLSQRRYPAKQNSELSLIPFLFNAGPYLLGICVVGMCLIRGCLSSLPIHIPLQAMAVTASSVPLQPSPIPSDRNVNRPSTNHPMSAGGRSTYIPEPEPPNVPPMLIADEEPLEDAVTVETRMPLGFFGNPEPVPWMDMRLEQPSVPMHQQRMLPSILQDSNPSPRSMSFDECPLFDSKRGRKFTGTSQMPGEASRRISLSIGAIRERGKNVEARLSTLDGVRASREYTGTLQQNPLKLILTPVLNSRSFGTFVTYMPWYSNSPTRIELALDVDGKMMIGTSMSGEEFELVAQADRATAARLKLAMPHVESFDGFDDPSSGVTRWIVEIATAAKPVEQYWEFQHQEEGKGNFAWHKEGRIVSTGTYAENAREGHLDIAIRVKDSTLLYLARFRPQQSGAGVEVCVPHRSADGRPSTISEKSGKVYFIHRASQSKP